MSGNYFIDRLPWAACGVRIEHYLGILHISWGMMGPCTPTLRPVCGTKQVRAQVWKEYPSPHPQDERDWQDATLWKEENTDLGTRGTWTLNWCVFACFQQWSGMSDETAGGNWTGWWSSSISSKSLRDCEQAPDLLCLRSASVRRRWWPRSSLL